ncbi:DUF6233 domain-containing protein [Streptomyces geranii]|uniref:DUF6233 domain-containing protein n=1 Tax=Streptomyces geranii TaxID=2058923 RepID=UPI001E52A9AA|nr:DUF6233 domain-containing protein [Streptomyces geranii]
MFDDLPPDLVRLDALRVWHALWLERIDRKIAHVRQRQAEEEHGRRTRPLPPDWIVELHRGTGEPLNVHDGACGMTGRRQRTISRDEARRLLTTGEVQACPFCHPDTQLHIIDLAARTDRPCGTPNARTVPPPTGRPAMTT